MASANKNRKRKKTDRYGENSDENMDGMFDAIDKSLEAIDKDDDKDDDYVAPSSKSSSDVSASESVEKTTFKENGSPNLLNRQLARLEVKINQMHLLLIQIQRASISNVTSSLSELDRILELPLQTVDMLNKFEVDLCQDSYRKKIVSISNLHTKFETMQKYEEF